MQRCTDSRRICRGLPRKGNIIYQRLKIMSSEKIGFLQSALSNFITTPVPPKLPLVNGEVSAWFSEHDIVFGLGMHPDGRAFGFNAAGAAAIRGLADALVAERPAFRTGIRVSALMVTLAKTLYKFVARENSTITSDELDQIEDAIGNWFEAETVARKFLIPCTILPEHATQFSIGPIDFFSVRDLAVREDIPPEQLTDHLKYGPLIQTMQQRAAIWIAEVEVSGFDEPIGTERANLAVDVALVAIQMVLPVSYSREIARITGRTMPPNIGTFFTTKHNIHTGSERREPGLGISGEVFDQQLVAHRALVESVGRRVDAYVRGALVLPKLEQAWCDGAFWLHEGLAEPLSTVAVAKLETAIEVMLSAESSKGSAARFRAAFESLYGLKNTDPIRPGNPQTVKQFIESIVGARSRVLHGTASTLSSDTSSNEQGGRPVFEMLALDLMRRFTLVLDEYVKDSAAVDDTESFLSWINDQRLKAPSTTKQ